MITTVGTMKEREELKVIPKLTAQWVDSDAINQVWKHRGEEGILARLLPTPLSRATLQGTKLFGVGKFFPQESLKAMNEFPTILVIWALSGETHKWGKGEREKQIRIHKIKGHGLY